MTAARLAGDLRRFLYGSWTRIAFTVWLSAIVFIQLVWVLDGKATDRTVAVSLLACGLTTTAMWCSRDRLARAVGRWGASPATKFVLIGSLGAAWVETVFWALEKAFHAKGVAASPNLAVDLLVTMPWYVMMVALLFRVERAHAYSPYEVLLLGGVYELGADGIIGPFIGGKFSAGSLPIALLLVPMFVVAYSLMVLPPTVLLAEDVGRLRGGAAAPAGDARRYAYALLPLVGLVPYLVLGIIIHLA
jgi:hypothetical protein